MYFELLLHEVKVGEPHSIDRWFRELLRIVPVGRSYYENTTKTCSAKPQIELLSLSLVTKPALPHCHQNDEFSSYLPNFVPKSISPSHANID